jgi:hypothetical protein
MILINSLVTAGFGWRSKMMSRIQRAAKELGTRDIVFYPEGPMEFEEIPQGSPSQYNAKMRLHKNLEFLQASLDFLVSFEPAKFKRIQKVVFLEVYQFPHVQMSLLGWYPLYEVLVHAQDNLKDYPFYGAKSIIEYTHMLRRILVQTPSTGASYGHVPYRVIGGFLEMYNNRYPKKRDAIMWASNRAYDRAKGWLRFLDIVQRNPNRQFVTCVGKSYKEVFDHPNIECYEGLTPDEYMDKCAQCKYILSTSETDSFSYGLFDAISVGCIPLVSDMPFHRDWIPPKFIYSEQPDFTIDASDAELAAITDPHYYHRTFERLIQL